MSEQTAIFAGGCFWCMVEPFDSLPGIKKVRAGYTGGFVDHPTYEAVLAHETGHTEAVKIWFDPSVISYSDLVELYWQTGDPTDAMGQFQDRGDNYRSVIFVDSAEQREIAAKSKQALQESGIFNDALIVTQIEDASTFWEAEEHHQDFYQKDPARYEIEHAQRQEFIDEHWQS
ncbi:MAG: peptide-methionine (S)-S-oxide reductase MsrA [Lactobacillaceae bacterium]|jgi:peptide-methionine (S)-S-oxide reductase|nr:peptide-methionine (S)-S-oxide reductase MsrA [Lactobacillaceae bacterium]